MCAVVLLIAGCGSSSSSRTTVNSSTTTITVSPSGQASTGAPAANSPVPKVTGDSEDKALAVLKKAGFKVTVTQQASNAPIGTVLSQSPAPGKMAAKGSTVSLILSG